MCVLQLTLGKLIYAKFSLVFWIFSVKLPDVRGYNGQTVGLDVRTRVTCPHVFEAAHIRTMLISRLDRDPTTSIKTGRRISRATPHKISLLASSE
jgi:hypothetical protein